MIIKGVSRRERKGRQIERKKKKERSKKGMRGNNREKIRKNYVRD